MKRKTKRSRVGCLAEAALDVAVSDHPLDVFFVNLGHGMLMSAIEKTPRSILEELTDAAKKTAKQFGAVELSEEEATELLK